VQNVTAEQVRAVAVNAGVLEIPVWKCDICEDQLFYRVDDSNLFMDYSCSCTDDKSLTLIHWGSASMMINTMADEEAQIAAMESFGFVFCDPDNPPQEAVQQSNKIPFKWEKIAEVGEDSRLHQQSQSDRRLAG